MSQSAAIAAFYDHEQDPARERDQERSAYDWGAGELFETMPRPRRLDHAGRIRTVRTAVDRAHESRPHATVAPAPAAPRPAIERPEHEALLRPRLEPSATPGGRRTVTVTGRPDPLPVRTSERRPAPTAADWLGARPDRVAGYAFAMGMLLILIAFLTASA